MKIIVVLWGYDLSGLLYWPVREDIYMLQDRRNEEARYGLSMSTGTEGKKKGSLGPLT